jgi:hypothetical protein
VSNVLPNLTVTTFNYNIFNENERKTKNTTLSEQFKNIIKLFLLIDLDLIYIFYQSNKGVCGLYSSKDNGDDNKSIEAFFQNLR